MGSDNEKAFVKGAYQALIDRGVITEDMLMPSTVTDEMLDAFEREYDVRRSWRKTKRNCPTRANGAV